MKKLYAIAVLLLVTFNVQVFSQTIANEDKTEKKLTVQERTDKIMEEYTVELTLSQEQVALVTPIIFATLQQRDEQLVTYAGNDEMLLSTRKQLISDTQDKLKNILSEDQLARLSKLWGSQKRKFK